MSTDSAKALLEELDALQKAAGAGGRPEASFERARSLIGHPDNDVRWQALITVGYWIESSPDAVWDVVLEHGESDDEDMRAGVSTVLLEHLLEHHFDLIFPRVRHRIVSKGSQLVDTLGTCSAFGEAEARWDEVRGLLWYAESGEGSGDVVDVDGRRNAQRPALADFNFATGSIREPRDLILECVESFRRRSVRRGLEEDLDPIPLPAATADEIDALEASLGVSLPAEYRTFLGVTRSLRADEGVVLFGVSGAGSTADEPWVSDGHLDGHEVLVVGDYFEFADGDQLLFDLGAPSESVYLYLHDPPYDPEGPRRRPCIEEFAPSFGLALYRLVKEVHASDVEMDEE